MIYRYKLSNFLNKRFSLRNLSDQEFESAIIDLSEQLQNYNYNIKHSEEDLRKDWSNLKNYSCLNKNINSTVRHGMKLCEHFMDNFWEIKDSKGRSFVNQWTSKNLEKVLRWNRKSHSTPYISEIRRGLYFCTGMTKSTMYRPSLAKTIVHKYSPNGIVLDPCAGWGGRLLGTIASGARYIAFEPNTKTYNNLLKLVEFLNVNVTLYNDSVENISNYDIPKVDLILTSPPYFNLEIYSEEETQSVKENQSYEDWVNNFLKPTIENCIKKGNDEICSAWNVADFGKYKMIEDVKKIHNDLEFVECNVFSVISSKRQSNQIDTKNAKRNDFTICYQKKV